jgi:hypothetical protein
LVVKSKLAVVTRRICARPTVDWPYDIQGHRQFILGQQDRQDEKEAPRYPPFERASLLIFPALEHILAQVRPGTDFASETRFLALIA